MAEKVPLPEYGSTRRFFRGSTCLAWCNGIMLALTLIGSLVAAILVTSIPHQIEELECGDQGEDNEQCCAFYLDYYDYKNGMAGGLQMRVWLLFGFAVLLLVFYSLWSGCRRGSMDELKTRKDWHYHFQCVRWFEFTMYFLFALYFVWATLIQNHLTTFIALPEFFIRLVDSCLDPLLEDPIATDLTSGVEDTLRAARDFASIPALIFAALALLFIALDRCLTLDMPHESDELYSAEKPQASFVPNGNTMRRRLASHKVDFE